MKISRIHKFSRVSFRNSSRKFLEISFGLVQSTPPWNFPGIHQELLAAFSQEFPTGLFPSFLKLSPEIFLDCFPMISFGMFPVFHGFWVASRDSSRIFSRNIFNELTRGSLGFPLILWRISSKDRKLSKYSCTGFPEHPSRFFQKTLSGIFFPEFFRNSCGFLFESFFWVTFEDYLSNFLRVFLTFLSLPILRKFFQRFLLKFQKEYQPEFFLRSSFLPAISQTIFVGIYPGIHLFCPEVFDAFLPKYFKNIPWNSSWVSSQIYSEIISRNSSKISLGFFLDISLVLLPRIPPEI